jgi:neutral ceramidase
MVAFLVERFARAITDAVTALRPAVAAWDSTRVWGVTRNRSLEAHLRNRPNPARPAPPPWAAHLAPRYLAVDPTLLMLRVDTVTVWPDGSREAVPAGAFSIFALHGTGNPIPNPLFDGDIHAHVERILERRMDAVAGYAPEYGSRTAHLFANGSAGDVSPDWPEDRVCPVATIRPVRASPGPRVPRPPVRWDPGSPAAIDLCLAQSRAYVDALGAELGDSAVALHGRLAGRLRSDLAVASAFRTVGLTTDSGLVSCREARVGTATLGGAEDGRTRYYRWRVLGVFDAGFEESPPAVRDDPDDCHGRKRPAGGLFVQRVVGKNHPRVAQLMVVRVGDVLVGAVPWEVTTEAGSRLRAAMVRAAPAGGPARAAALVTLANGYLQYLTTPEEYDLQQYEGASNLYGPRTAEMAAARLERLAAAVVTGGLAPVVPVIAASPGSEARVLKDGSETRAPDRRVREIRVKSDTVLVRFVDAQPGSFRPDLGAVIRFERREAGGFVLAAWDDDPRVEVYHRRDREWEARWTGCQPGAQYRVVLPARDILGRDQQPIRLPRLEGPDFTCP